MAVWMEKRGLWRLWRQEEVTVSRTSLSKNTFFHQRIKRVRQPPAGYSGKFYV